MDKRKPILVDTLHPRLLVTRWTECFRFYNSVLPALTGAKLAKGDEAWPYARFDVDVEKPILALANRAVIPTVPGQEDVPRSGDGVLLCFRVADVDAAQRVCESFGATVVVPAYDQVEWGPDTRIALVRDPDGNLVELQSSPE